MKKFLMLLLPLAMVFSSCTKEPGEGGRGEIQGRIIAQNYNNTSTGLAYGDPYPFPEHRVYIIYGDGEFHDDDVRTGHDGRYRFNGLRRGSYRIYVVSELYRSLSEPDGSEIIERTVEITEKDEVIEIEDLLVKRYRSWQN
ncbi:MAG: carboxypeptidase-like regulatory domain-containing protein [Bacteroidota bacterium]|nr:carboxypeptidase-like regulatory domain-containing protein [Bacteroidota bacterium]